MLGRAADRHGSCCGGPPGLDCADYSKSKHQQRRIERRQWRREADREDVEPDVETFFANIHTLDAGPSPGSLIL
jgi:hypothetical protein